MEVCFDVGHVLCCQGQSNCLAAQSLGNGLWELAGVATSGCSLLSRGRSDAVRLAIDFRLPRAASRLGNVRGENPHQLVNLGLLHFRDDVEQRGIVIDLWSPVGWLLAEEGLARLRKALLIRHVRLRMRVSRDYAQEQIVDEPVLRPLLLLGAAQTG